MKRIMPFLTEVQEARIRLSIAVSERKYLGKWIRDAEALTKAKEANSLEQSQARAVLFKYSNTIWYYKDAPTKGNNFKTTPH